MRFHQKHPRSAWSYTVSTGTLNNTEEHEGSETSMFRVLLVIVALHVLVIGGLFLYDYLRSRTPFSLEPASEEHFEPEPVLEQPAEPVLLKV